MEIIIREVWAHNLESEFELLRSLIDEYPIISMDTEFPGVYYPHPDPTSTNKHTNYHVLKNNVDALHVIQLGLTLSDTQGNLPSLGSHKYSYVWQFNFNDFDLARDKHVHSSIQLLLTNGIDLDRMNSHGVESCRFSELMMSSGLVCNESVTWVVFHGAYDFGYLIKAVTQQALPEGLEEFERLVAVFFGDRVYDVKQMIRMCDGVFGGLDTVAKAVGLTRTVGRSHTAGSDSLLTWRVFQKIRDDHFRQGGPGIDRYAGVLFGLEVL